MEKKKTIRKIGLWLGIVIATPIVLFLILAVLIYLPPVQRFAVRQATTLLSESTGMNISIDRIRLAFPLDLSIGGIKAIQGRDTLLDARALRVGVRLCPLVHGRVEVDGISLFDTRLNTLDLISDTHIQGQVGSLSAALPEGVDLINERVAVDRVLLKNTDIAVVLSDTAKKDTTPSTSRWDIRVRRADVVNTTIRLRMPGDSMRIGTSVGRASLRGGHFDTGRSFYAVNRFVIDHSAASYDVPQASRQLHGIDPNHIAVDQLRLRIDSLSYDSAGRLGVRLDHLSFSERSGLNVDRLSGRVALDTLGLRLPRLTLTTPHSQLTADVTMDWRAFTPGKGGKLSARIGATLGYADLITLAGDAIPGDIRSLLPARPIKIQAAVDGNADHFTIDRLEADLASLARLTAKGSARDIIHPNRSGHLDWNLRTGNLNTVSRLLPSSIALPNKMSVRGRADFRGDDYRLRLVATALRGRINATAQVNPTTERYAVRATAHSFPVGAFLPGMGLSDFSGRINASGHGFDPLARSTTLKAEAVVEEFQYDRYPLGGLHAKANLTHGKGQIYFKADNPLVQGTGTLDATLSRKHIAATLAADLPLIGLQRITEMKDTLDLGTNLTVNVGASTDFSAFEIDGSLSNIRFLMPTKSATMKDITFAFGTSPDTTHAMMKSGDLDLYLLAHGGVDKLSHRLSRFASLLSKQLEAQRLDQEALKHELPRLSLYVNAGRQNPASKVLAMKGIDIDSVYINMNADPLIGLNGKSELFTLRTGGLQLDDISFDISQDSNGVKMQGVVVNSADDNPNKFEVRTNAYILPTGAGVEFKYIDNDRNTGVDIGVQAALVDSGIRVHFYPEHPVIAYRNFTVNRDNYIYLTNRQKVYADVDLLADDGTGLKIYGQPNDSVNDLTVSVNRLNLGELSNVLPYMPQLSGLLSGDVHVLQSRTNLSAMTMLEIDDMAFEGTSLGRIGLNATYMPDSGHHVFDASILRNDREVLLCSGIYTDKNGGLFDGNAQLSQFPLALANGFMAGSEMAFNGNCNGDIALRGPVDNLRINGQIAFDSAHIYSDAYGLDFRMDEKPIKIEENRLALDDFDMFSTGKEPLRLNGSVDFSDFSRIRLALDMKANNYELINSKRKRESLVFGKVFANFDGSLRGTTDNLYIRGQLDVLGNTDMTYILKDSPLTVEDQLSGLVQFVNFEDSLAVAPEEASIMGLDLTLGINISEAAHFRCDLSDDKESYVDLEGGGNLNLKLTQQGDMRLTGRFTTNSGEMKYALPVIPLKTFQLVEGSYVDFTGDVMNPTLNITAKERVKASVTENDVPRSVSFNVGVAITKPLENMGLEFIIEAPEDLSVQNQLAAMSAEQRGKVAVTLLATGMYITDESGSSTGGFKANDALNAFLQSEIQSIAGSALRTIDISLGVENGTSSAGNEQTDYSFQFAKRFWGNRISVIIGGKVSTGADAENSAESFIDNVSIEYRLDKSSTRHVKAFYDRNTNDPLEGLLTKTGAGLVLRRKTNRLGELFIFRTKKNKTDTKPNATK